jgi:hypothetical protein
MNKKFIILAILFGALSVVLRLLPHAPNFAPIGALALFAGIYFPKKWGIVVPILVMIISDFFIGFYDLKLMGVVYGSFLIMTVFGYFVRRGKNFINITFGILGGSIFFFITTNFAVWALSDWYPHTIGGLIYCYTLALPFFKSSLMSNIFYGGIFFGVYEFMDVLAKQLKQKKIVSFFPLVNNLWTKPEA